jgi:OPA family glycerol-3-phosphate transporter-like MFS transporter
VLGTFFAIDFILVRDTPSHAGLADFDTADASSGDDGPQLGVIQVAKLMLMNRVIVIIALVEFCSGFLRNAIMQWYIIFAHQTGIQEEFVPKNWGLLLCLAGILGGVVAGIVSDRVFDSRRAPMVSVLYGGSLFASVIACFSLSSPAMGWIAVWISLCIIGVHGMFSGTASMDFGGRKNVGVAVGIIDGLVYLGTATQSVILGALLPTGEAQKDPAQWAMWPRALIPAAVIGFFLATRVWGAKPSPARAKADSPADSAERSTSKALGVAGE